MGTKQQVLIMYTEGDRLRSEADGWTAEDPRGAKQDGHVGICGAWWSRLNGHYGYPDPLRALADGWRLLAPPVCQDSAGSSDNGYEWWFVRDVPDE